MDEKLEILIARAERLAEIERFREAIPPLLKVLAQNPQHFQANCLLSLCHYSLKDFAKAQEFAEKAITAAPDEEWGHRLRSVALTEQGRKKDALSSAEEAARLAPFEPLALQTLANAFLSENLVNKAEETAIELRDNFPEMEASFFTLGNVYLQKGDNSAAEKCFRESLRLNPNSSDARNNLGVALLRQLDHHDNALFKTHNYSILKTEHEDEIHTHFTEAIKLEPNHELAAENLKNQFSYFNVLCVFLFFLPFMTLAFLVAPGMVVLLGFLFMIGLLKVCWEIRQKRKNLAPEIKIFLKSSSPKDFSRRWQNFSALIGALYKKTWKPHALAIFAVFLCHFDFGEPLDGGARNWHQGLALILIIVSMIWLTAEIRKD